MIIISDTELEEVMKNLLQKKLKFWIKNKAWREGRLLLFKQNGFYLELIIKGKKKDRERFEIPIPFGFEEHFDDGIVYFDYQLTSLVGTSHYQLVDKLSTIETTGKSRFYNSILEIQVIPDVII